MSDEAKTPEGFERELIEEYRRQHPHIAEFWNLLGVEDERMQGEWVTFEFTAAPINSTPPGVEIPIIWIDPGSERPEDLKRLDRMADRLLHDAIYGAFTGRWAGGPPQDPYDRAVEQSKKLREPKQLPPYLRVIK